MGRTEPSWAPAAQQGFRKDQRAKQARATVNKTIPQILSSDSRARKGIVNAQLISGARCEPSHGSKASGRAQKRGSSAANEASEASNSHVALPADESEPVRVRIQVADTLLAARDLHQNPRSKKNVAILNMASPLRPGGGVLNGATSQEESLCSRTTLLPSLKEEWYRLPEIGGIWSPDVLVFRLPGVREEHELPKSDRFYVDVISAAMIRFPDVVENPVATHGLTDDSETDDDDESGQEEVTSTVQNYAHQKDRDLALAKMRSVLGVLAEQKKERVVLGAWGCGAYGNPTHEIAAAWKRAIFGNLKKPKSQSPSLGSIKEIVFAIKEPRMAQDFARAWGDEIELEHAKVSRSAAADAAHHEEHIEELAQKIESLELQIGEVKTPMLKQSLQGTLDALRRDLANAGQEASEENEAEEEDS